MATMKINQSFVRSQPGISSVAEGVKFDGLSDAGLPRQDDAASLQKVFDLDQVRISRKSELSFWIVKEAPPVVARSNFPALWYPKPLPRKHLPGNHACHARKLAHARSSRRRRRGQSVKSRHLRFDQPPTVKLRRIEGSVCESRHGRFTSTGPALISHPTGPWLQLSAHGDTHRLTPLADPPPSRLRRAGA